MRRLFILISLVSISVCMLAVPAKRGLWQTLKLTDGTEVRVQLCGDEFLHYWKSADGVCYQTDSANVASQIFDMSAIISNAKACRSNANTIRMARAKRMTASTRSAASAYTGVKKGLIILVQFSDKSFGSGHNKALFNNIANADDYLKDSFKGSVSDYFKAQSSGSLDLDFDVIGPVTLNNPYSYYGKDSGGEGYDSHPGQMVAEACTAIADSVNFSDYDWDGDGYVDQVFVLYAGHGQASYTQDSNTIWPHEWDLESSDYSKVLSIDGVTINTYACSSELGYDNLDGIGTICHEFSHCLGLPDMYDTIDTDGTNFGMAEWDLMDYGSYNGDGFIPSGYTSYEKMFLGWLTPTVLSNNDVEVTGLQALSDGGGAYIIYNANNANEYYLLENRQQTGWDAGQYGAGLLVLHVDYDADVWYNNTVNNDASHQRCTIFHADNQDGYSYESDLAGDPYPYNSNDSLTNNSTPKATLYNANTDGTKYMNHGITDITQNSDGTISFNYKAVSSTITKNIEAGDTIFYESFDKCNGTGGNDGKWSGRIASSAFIPDNTNWTASSNTKYGADKCAKFNSSTYGGNVKSPAFTLNGNATLSFKIAPWANDGNSVDVYFNNTLIDSYTLASGQWTEISTSVSGSGSSTITFMPSKRFFLDEVLVKSAATSGISNIKIEKQNVSDNRIYSISGQYLGTDTSVLKHGIYIINGRKVVK